MKTAVPSLVVSYAKLNPLPEASPILEEVFPTNFLDRLWSGTAFETNRNATLTIVDDTLNLADGTLQDLKVQLAGQVSGTGVTDALRFVDHLIQAATKAETLHQNVNGNSQFPRYIQYGGFLRELTELGFEIRRVKPTTTAGVNELSEWIENLLEEGGTGTGIRLASGGLSQLFDGFELNQSNSMNQMGAALDYLGRLVRAAEAVDDVNLDQQVLNAKFLSHLVNLGSTYATLNPFVNPSPNPTFLDIAWNSSGVVDISNTLESFLNGFATNSASQGVLQFSRNTLMTLKLIPELQQELRSQKYLAASLGIARSDFAMYITSTHNFNGTYIPLIAQASSSSHWSQLANLMMNQGGYLISEPVLVASNQNGGLIASSSRYSGFQLSSVHLREFTNLS